MAAAVRRWRFFFVALAVAAAAAAQDQPRLLKSAEPRYPEAALRSGAEGRVLLRLSLDARGRVTGAAVLRAEPRGLGFEEAALDAARDMQFEPLRIGGRPVASQLEFEMRLPPPGRSMEEQIQVVGRPLDHLGGAESASAGSYTRELLQDRPLLRPGEVEELVPGLIVTQHSGAGKANQFFLRGFNLDHGTDFATSVEGIPVNLPSHAHGQGYDDLNFLIPELIGHVDYFKGPYFASKGDFASAGAADIFYLSALPHPLLEASAGSFGDLRAVGAGSAEFAGGALLGALEAGYERGPWVHPDAYRKLNGVLRWTREAGDGQLSLLFMGYGGAWNSTDQIPERAVASGALGNFDAIDPSDGGSSHRASLSAAWSGDAAAGRLRANAYAVRYDLDLFSDFTYFLDDPARGDQIEQREERNTFGTSGSWLRGGSLAGLEQEWQLGWDGRVDRVGPLGLYHAAQRQRLQAFSADDVKQWSGALWGDAQAKLSSWLRVSIGLRATAYDFAVQSSDARNSGSATAALLLPKATAVFGPWSRTELFVDYGDGYHSNDARGITAAVDARTGAPVQPVTPLPRSRGYEAGVRSEAIPTLQASLALWRLDLESELVWDGDAGTTAPSAATRRQGIEASARWQPAHWLLFDLDAALSRARFFSGGYVPDAIDAAGSAGASLRDVRGWSASLFLRYFGPRALTQDGAVRSRASALVDAQLSRRLGPWTLTLDAFNLFDAQADDMAYFYVSRLRGEPPAGVADLHFHPAEPLSFRGTAVLAL